MRLRVTAVVLITLLLAYLISPRSVAADVGPRLTPFSWRGGAILALMAVVMAIIAVMVSVRRRRRNDKFPEQQHESPASILPTRSNTGGSRVGSAFSALFQISIGVLVVVGLTGLARQTILMPKLPAGWFIIRPPNEVTTLAETNEIIWAGGRDGLWAIDRHTNELLILPNDRRKMKRIKDLLVDSYGVLWIAHQEGLTSFDGQTWEDHSGTRRLAPGPVYALLEDRDGHLWMGNNQGAARFDGNNWQSYTTRDGLGSTAVTVIYQDEDGAIWFGSDSADGGGLSRYDGRDWEYYSIADGLAHNSINMIYQDLRGDIWFAGGFGNEGGATRLRDGVMESWTEEDGLAGGKVRSIFEDEVGRLWFGSEYDGMAVFDGQTFRILTPKDGLAGWEVKHMLQDSDGIYWLGTENGLSRIDSYDQ